MHYAGIGSRKTSDQTLDLMRRIAFHLATQGWTLRSGGAEGADTAFELGATQAGGKTEIFVPRAGFFGRSDAIAANRLPAHQEALRIAEAHHRNWAALSPTVRQLMARNVHQILGMELSSPVRFVLCWAPCPVVDAEGIVSEVRGGTGQAVRIAYTYGVPVFHLGVPDHLARIEAMLAKEASCHFSSTPRAGCDTTA